MERKGMYIYGLLNSNANLQLSIPKELLLEESESNAVYTIAYQGISALVGGSEIVDYTHMRKDILARLLVGHQTVIERVMTAQTTIIPMRLGTHAQDETEVRDILRKGYNLIKEVFEKINNKIEIDITATWGDLVSVIKEVGEEKEIKEFKEKLLNNPKGLTADDQMKIGFMLKNELDKKRDNYASQIEEALKTVSPDFKAHELMDDKMVVNTAFLIDKDKREDFYKKVEELNVKFDEKLNFRCVGPLPAYSFFTIEIKKMQFNEVNLARKRLGILEDRSSKDDIKKAFHRQVFISHPDRNPDKPGIEKEYDEVTRSYNILLDYAQACEQVGQGSLIFNEDEFKKNAVLVKVRE
ncbi:MAG: GvpL/GvpF family gas vesicle protein [Candidatus Omnitrophota bacterium]|nr:GvpL/GvpF family gas vesicle protein [Candidatus Omnitrophota bacterium]